MATGTYPWLPTPPSGCRFYPRYPLQLDRVCVENVSSLVLADPGHYIRCLIPVEELKSISEVMPIES